MPAHLRLVFKHVETRPRDLPFLQRARQRRLIDDGATGRIDEKGGGFMRASSRLPI